MNIKFLVNLIAASVVALSGAAMAGTAAATVPADTSAPVTWIAAADATASADWTDVETKAATPAPTPAPAQDQFAELRAELAQVLKECPAGPNQRACIYDFRKKDTALYDMANPPKNDTDRAFRACTTNKALELETEFTLDMLQLSEDQWLGRVTTMEKEVQANWLSCLPKK